MNMTMIAVICVSAVIYYAIWRVDRIDKRLQDWIASRIFGRRSKDTDVDLTFAAKRGIGRLPAHMDFIAGFGKTRSAPEIGQGGVLTPTLGLRFISVLLTLACLWIVWFGPPEYTGGSLLIKSAITAALAYAAIYIQLYSLSFDAERFSHRGWTFRYREYLWRDLVSIQDNGHYVYALRMKGGAKVDVQKYLVGIPAFVAYAKDRIVQNNLM